MRERRTVVRRSAAGLAWGLALVGLWAGEARAQSQQCTVTAGRTSITFKTIKNNTQIKILNMIDLPTGAPLQVGGSAIWQVVFAADPAVAPAPAWDEQRVPPAAPVATSCGQGTIYRRGYPIARASTSAVGGAAVTPFGQGGCVLTWDDVPLPVPATGNCFGSGSPGVFDVRVEVQPKTIPGCGTFLAWNGVVTIEQDVCDYWRIKNLKLPLFALRELGAGGEDDYVAFPTNQGMVIRNPIANRQPYPEEALSGDPNIPNNDRIARRFTYPARVQSQFMAYYDDEVSTEEFEDEARVGLYVAADDVAGFMKRFYFGTIIHDGPAVPVPDEFLQMHVTHLNGGDDLDDFKSLDTDMLQQYGEGPRGYEVLTTTYEGDWWDAAMMYRCWLEARNPDFLPEKLSARAPDGESVRAAIELAAGVVSRHDNGGTVSRANLNDPNSELSKLRAWSEFYRRVNDPTEEPLECMELAANFNNRGNLFSLDYNCNDEHVLQTPAQPGIDMIRQLRVPLTPAGGCGDVAPLYRWTIANTDAGNYNSVVPASCNPSLWTDLALPRQWNGAIVADTSVLKTFTSSGSDWLTNCLRIGRWSEYMLVTNDVASGAPFVPALCPPAGPCPPPIVVPPPVGYTADWLGFNSIAFTGDGPVAYPSYAPLHSPGHTHRGTTHSGGGTYWMDNYLDFIRGVKNNLYAMSTVIPTPGGGPAPQTDLRDMIAGTERAHEWILPEAAWFGKLRTVPFDIAQRAPIAWLSSAGARHVPFLSMIFHDYVPFGGHMLERSELLKIYAGQPLAQIDTTSPQEMMSLRARADMAQIVLGGSFPSLSMSTDLEDPDTSESAPPGATFSPILFDGPPDPGFSCPDSTGVSWIGGSSALQSDYDYYKGLFALRPLFKDHLVYGRRFRDPAVTPQTPDCLTTTITDYVRPEFDGSCVMKTPFIHEQPHIYGSVFTDLGDVPALFFTNVYRTDLGVCASQDYAFTFTFDPTELGLAPGTYRLWKVERDGCADSGTCAEQAALGTFTVDVAGQSPVFTSGPLTLPPGESVVLFASPTDPCVP